MTDYHNGVSLIELAALSGLVGFSVGLGSVMALSAIAGPLPEQLVVGALWVVTGVTTVVAYLLGVTLTTRRVRRRTARTLRAED